MTCVYTGLEVLSQNDEWDKSVKGNIAILCHSASIDRNYNIAVKLLIEKFSNRVKKILGPQHGFVTDVQDNMIETKNFIHPYFKIPVYSLYSETRRPTPEMLDGIDTLVIDLQDVGTRVYTYIWTMFMAMEECGKRDIRVIVLDRPNPVGGDIIEGNLLDMNYSSFVGMQSIPMRHGMTIGEMAKYFIKFCSISCDISVVPMKNWSRKMFFQDTNLPWVLPSPNLPTIEGALTFVGSVLFEGTNISEGRGTTRSLEIIGHPSIEPFEFADHLNGKLDEFELDSVVLRPLMFMPTFQKHANKTCGGIQIHVTDNNNFKSWRLGQLLCREFYSRLGNDFSWKRPPYEYEYDKLPIDLINGTDLIREWVEKNGQYKDLRKIEQNGINDYINNRNEILMY